MDFTSSLIFECLSRLILKERREHSGYYTYLNKEGLVNFRRSSASLDERAKHLIGGIRQAGYTLQDAIKNDRSLSLDKLYDLLHTTGRVFLLDVKVLNNGKELKMIKLAHSELLLRPMRLFVFGLKDKKAFLTHQFKPIQVGDKSSQSTSGTNATALPKSSEVNLSDSDTSLSSCSSCSSDEEGGGVPVTSENRCDSNAKQGSSESNNKRKHSDGKEGKVEEQTKSIKIVKYTSDDEGYTVIRKRISHVNDQILEQRKNLLEIVKKHSEWTHKLEKHVLGHVTSCNLCPVHCYGLLAKQISRQSGRKIGNTSKPKQ